jgi:putative two-component system response regulator
LPSPNTAVVESPGAEREHRQAASQVERQSFQGHEEPILVVDDNPMFCRVLDRLLRREGFAPYFAENGVAALTKLTASSDVLPKVIICDLHMPLMNGRELIARLKEDPRFKHIPIIVLTSDEDADVELQLLQHGADAYVSKVKDPRVLTSYVRKMARPLFAREAA